MRSNILNIFIIAVILTCFCSFNVFGNEIKKDIQTTIHLLDYISRDYTAAVQNGKVINDGEYAEMLEFSYKVIELIKNSELNENEKANILAELKKMKGLIDRKAPHENITTVAGKSRQDIIEAAGFKTAPLTWPNLKNGETLYVQNCTACHGVRGAGDGKLAAGLVPAPTNFLNHTLMQEISPFQAYNTIKLGVEGTAMQSFESLTDEEIWDLAFYIKSLRFETKADNESGLQQLFEQANAPVNLQEVATLSDVELLKRLEPDNKNAKLSLAVLRTQFPQDVNRVSTLDRAKTYLKNALQNYTTGSYSSAREDALAAYLEGIEPSEARLKANDPAFTARLEQQMFKIRQIIEQKAEKSKVETEINNGLDMIDQAGKLMQDKKLNYWLSFALSASIML